MGIRGKRVLIPRAAQAREILPERLSEEGAEVDVIPVYETSRDEDVNTEELIRLLEAGEVSMITFTSSSTVINFFSSIEGKIDTERLKGVDMASIGPITGKKLEERGIKAKVMPETYTITDLVRAICEFYTKDL